MDLEQVREALGAVAIVFGFIGAVLVLALADVGLFLLLLCWARNVRALIRLPQPDALPDLPAEHPPAVVIGGGLKRWE